MEDEKHTEQVNTRVPFGLIKEMDELIDAGRYRDRGDFALAAIRHYLDHVAVDRRYTRLEPPGQASFEELAKSAREKP